LERQLGRPADEIGKAGFSGFVAPFLLQRAGNAADSAAKRFFMTLWHSCAKNGFLSCSLSYAKGTLNQLCTFIFRNGVVLGFLPAGNQPLIA
jgi:hypothetical protein